MAQFVIYGHSAALRPRIGLLSDAIHEAAVAALQLPANKRFHRFVPLDPASFIAPSDRSLDYTIIEVSMFEAQRCRRETPLNRALPNYIGGRTRDPRRRDHHHRDPS
jgi:hypothetical protein